MSYNKMKEKFVLTPIPNKTMSEQTPNASHPANVVRAVEKTRKMVLDDIETLEKASVNNHFSKRPLEWEDFFDTDYNGGCPFLHLRGELLDQLRKLEDRFSSGDEWGVSESLSDLEWVYQKGTNSLILTKAKEVA